MRKIKRIEPSAPRLPTTKRVAAYARVSVEKGRTLNSLSAQVSHYSAYIQRQPGWEYAGVYVDSGETGTSKGRGEFQRLIDDCEFGKIDIILTKSISRFARNTVDLLETVRRLRELGVEVRFEEQHINSLSGDGELMMTILASFAQEESRSLSENVKWAIRKGFKEGKPNSFNVYGYRWDGEKFVTHPEEASVVRMVFADYLDGKSPKAIARKLTAMGVKPMYVDRFPESTVRMMLENDKYTGNLVLQKTFIESHINQRERKNNGELPKYVLADAHEAIIDRDTFVRVQAEKKRRRDGGCFTNPAIKTNVFTSIIKCGKCGLSFRRKGWLRKGRRDFKVWTCATKDSKGSAFCNAKTIPEEAIKIACTNVLGLAEFDEEIFAERVAGITAHYGNKLTFYLDEGTETTTVWEWKSTARKDCWTPERRAAWSEFQKNRHRARQGKRK